AAVVDVWLLLEYRPAWRAKAITDNALGEGVRSWLAQGLEALEGQGHKVRAQFIRQPEIDLPDTRLLVHHDGVLRAFESGGPGYDGLIRTPIEALFHGNSGERLEAPRYFVCTNGQRDLCCARFGLPLYNRLRERLGERVWQVTHLGGHRFAPNVLVLPQGVLYGRVGAEDESIERFVAEVEAGRVPRRHLRGRSCYPKPVQAAEGFAGLEGLEWVASEVRDSHTRVTFDHQGESLLVNVAMADEAVPVLASCGDQQLQSERPYRLVD
ncbi:MAG: sucrase ferredoxin, partial [Gammaproteobacteria bacterium]|nr:sucrase ferredoxin [Gammaproteobacteria bacterium]